MYARSSSNNTSCDLDPRNKMDVKGNGSSDEPIGNCTANNKTDMPYGMMFHQLDTALIVALGIIPIGLILNILCFVIFIKSKTYQSATGIHLTYLALADNLVLVSIFMWSHDVFSKYIDFPGMHTMSYVACVGPFYLSTVGVLWSGLLLSSATIERFISVAFPIRIRMWNLYYKSKILMLIYMVVSFGISGFGLLCLNIMLSKNGQKSCVENRTHAKLCSVWNTVVYSTLSNGVCSFTIFVFTILTSVYLFKYKNKRAKLGQQDVNDSNNKEFQITLMLVTVATLFLILRLPEMILYQVMAYYRRANIYNSVYDTIIYIYPIFSLLIVLNHTINFVIYFVFLGSFRRTFVSLFPCCFKHINTDGASSCSMTGVITDISSSHI